MTLQWTFAAGWNKIFSSRIIATVFEYGNFFFNVIIFVMVLLLLDSIREVRKYNKIEEQRQDLHNNPQAETMAQMRLFRAQRNLYISGFSLFLLIVLRRVVKLLSGYSVLEASNEAGIRQAQSASKQCEELMAENKKLKESLEAAGEEPETASKGEDEIKEELRILQESLEEKSKKLAERTQELEKTKLDLAALKEQASGLTREYDRLLEEHSKAQVVFIVLL
ncbi:B-cell receptor-associated protein 31 [Acropora cervicornis]|uniref:Endoplasmic reticulum transmembrane protein n=1 Tax=Acropora cervicornis TaxID=6130 RepID=A0AAD9VEE9_ACRCE|nr:B-cell receptor-associated protein 31 [Acropora cervicornis]